MRINFNVAGWPLSSVDRLVVVIKWRKIPVNVTLISERKVDYKCSGLPIYCISNRRNDVVTQVQLYHSKDTNYSNCVIYSMMSWWIDITDIFYPLTHTPSLIFLVCLTLKLEISALTVEKIQFNCHHLQPMGTLIRDKGVVIQQKLGGPRLLTHLISLTFDKSVFQV